MKFISLLGFAFFVLTTPLKAQPGDLSREAFNRIELMEDTLSFMAYTVVNDSSGQDRKLACRNLIKTLVRTLKTENSFDYPFERLKSVSIQYPADSSFRIFTWQLYVDSAQYRYYGAIQMNRSELQLYPLIDRSFEIQDANLEKVEISPDRWYGALYYRLQQVDAPHGKYYLLYGYDAYRAFRHRKLIDVLTFDPQTGEPRFGAPVFKHGPDTGQPPTKNRVVIQYSATSSVRMNYDEMLEMIVFDHLVTMQGRYGEGPVNVPDGSYEGYRLENGYWQYVPKVFDQVQDEPPRPLPVLDQRTKDLFGNDKG